MEFNISSPSKLIELLENENLNHIPLSQHPQFLLLSAAHLQHNFHLLENSGYGGAKIMPFFLTFQTKKGVLLGYIPILRIIHNNKNLDLVPAKSLKDAIFKKKWAPTDFELLKSYIAKAGYHFQYQAPPMGWALSSQSLFSIFAWFPEDERKKITEEKWNITIKEITFSQGKTLLESFYSKNIEKIKNLPSMIHRDFDLFQGIFTKNYRLFTIEANQVCIGVNTFIGHLNYFYFMELLGNSLFYKLYPKILFEFFKLAKKENIKIIYTTFFEWCLIPFVSKIVSTTKVDLSKLIKKTNQMRARNLKGV